MVIWALVSLLFLQIALSSVLNMKRAADNFSFKEAVKRSELREVGEFRGITWRRQGETVVFKKGKRKIKVKREESNEGIRVFPR